MDNERLYIMKDASGKESEPVDQMTLVKWAERGDITLDCKIRSTIIPNWDAALDVPFLKPYMKQQLAKKIEAQHDNWKTRILAKISRRIPEPGVDNLSDPSTYPTASTAMRFLAWLTDTLILALVALAIFLCCVFLFKRGIVGGNSIFYLGFSAFWLVAMLYYTLFLGKKMQTPGQVFWGIYLMRENGLTYWVGRAFFYFIFLIPFGIFTPFFKFMTPSGRGLQEIFTGTRVIKVVFDKNKSKH